LLREKYAISGTDCILENNAQNIIFSSYWYRFIASWDSIWWECWDYPFIEGNFGIYESYMMMYNQDFPTRYLLKKPDISWGFDIWWQLNIEFIE
jgi:hypothetical protein